MLKKQRAEHANEEIDPIGWLRVTHGRSQEERWRLNVEELKRQIKSSSEKFRRLHCLHLISHAFLRAHTRTTLCEFQHFHLHPSRSDRCHPLSLHEKYGEHLAWLLEIRMHPKKICRTVTDSEQSTQKTWLTAASQYFSESTAVLSRQYSSTLGAVLEYFHRSTRVFLGEYSSIPTEVLWRPRFFAPPSPFSRKTRKGVFRTAKGEVRKTSELFWSLFAPAEMATVLWWTSYLCLISVCQVVSRDGWKFTWPIPAKWKVKVKMPNLTQYTRARKSKQPPFLFTAKQRLKTTCPIGAYVLQ